MTKTIVNKWQRSKRVNKYYHDNLKKFTHHLIPSFLTILELGSRGGELLSSLPNRNKVGIEVNADLLKIANRNKKVRFVGSLSKVRKQKFDYVLINHTLSVTDDIQGLIHNLKGVTQNNSKIVVYHFNYLWKPFLAIAEKIGLMMPWGKEPNWLSQADIDNLFFIEGFEKVKSGGLILLPIKIYMISDFINKYLATLPILKLFCLSNFTVYRQICPLKNVSVSIIIPARNESGHMKGILKKIPKLGNGTEIIFVEGGSSDNTYNVIKEEIKKYKGPLKASLWKQKGKGKGDAVRLGFLKARNDILMILDADLTVHPRELIKFYNAISNGKAEFVMGSRLVYPMENEAMRSLNYLANHLFGVIFSFLLNQRIKDTLCGTKVISKQNYKNITQNRFIFGDFDPFGDFDLIFGASKLNLKILEIPVRYKKRVYGTTNISRFSHGVLLLRMVLVASKKLKFI